MRKMVLFMLALMLVTTAVWAGGHRERTPKVSYIEPKNDAIVDLRGKENLEFSWKGSPTPGGGRLAYKFELYKEFSYEVIVSEKLDPKVFSIEVPVDKFADGVLYSWQVKQQDAHKRFWSMDNRWSFRVRK